MPANARLWTRQFINPNGLPYAGAKIYTYKAGTTSNKTIWTDAGQTTGAPNPVIADSRGNIQFYGKGNYRLVVTDSNDVTLYDFDDVWIEAAPNHLIRTSDYDTWAEAINEAIGKTLVIDNTVNLLAGAITIPATVLGVFPLAPGVIGKGAATSLTINAPVVGNPMHQWLSGFAAGELLFGDGSIKYVLPQWFGAKGDNSNNDTAGIQSAIDALYASGARGGIVFMPKGQYLVTQVAKLWANANGITIQGAGRNSTLISKYGAGVETLFDFSSAVIRITDFRIKDLGFQGGDYSSLAITDLALFSVSNIYFIAGTVGLDLKGAITGVVEECHFYACQTGSKLNDFNQGGSNFIKFRDCSFRGCTTLAVDFIEDTGLIFEDCNFETCGTTLTSPTNLLAASWDNNPAAPYGTLTSSGGNITSAIASAISNASNNITNLSVNISYTISYNLTLNSGAAPLLYVNTTQFGGATNIFGALKTGSNFITFTGLADSNYMVIQSNEASNFSLTISLYASNVTGAVRTRPTLGQLSGLSMLTIRDCWFEANKGWDVYMEPNAAVYASIQNCIALGSEFGVFVGKVRKFTMINNFWPNCDLQFDSSGVNTVGFVVNNVFHDVLGTTGHYIHMVGTDYGGAFVPVWASNIVTNGTMTIGNGTAIAKHLSGTVTYDPASIANGAQQTTTVTVTGAALGNTVVASFTLDLQGIQLTGYVSAANTITVIFQNNTGGAIDLASGTLRADVWQH